MSRFYSAFGLGLQANRPFPGLMTLPGLSVVDVEIFLDGFPAWLRRLTAAKTTPWYVSPIYCQKNRPLLEVRRLEEGNYFWLCYWEGVEFVIDRLGTKIWARCPAEANEDYLSTYLCGQVLGFMLRLRRVTCLHASAIAVGQHALALAGPKGAGKSTTAAAFAQLGYAVLSDDIVVVKDQGQDFLVFPGGTRLCLWPKAVTYLYGSPDALPYLIPENYLDPGWDKRSLDLTSPGYQFQSQPLPLRAIYVLGERAVTGPKVEALSGRAGLLALLANTSGSDLVDNFFGAQEFEALSRLLDGVVVRRVTPHPDPAYLPGMCELIVEDFHALSLPPLSSKASS